MNKLTKIASVVLCSATALSLVACGKKTTTKSITTAKATTQAKATTTKKATTTGVKTVETTKLTLAFNTNGGNAIESMQVAAGGTITLPDNPTKDGYKFIGWYENADFSGKEFNGEIMPNRNITLYAKWEELVKLTSPVGQVYSYLEGRINWLITEDNKVELLTQAGAPDELKDMTVDEIKGFVVSSAKGMTIPPYTLYIKTINQIFDTDHEFENLADLKKDFYCEDSSKSYIRRGEAGAIYSLDADGKLSFTDPVDWYAYMSWYFIDDYNYLVANAILYEFQLKLVSFE